MRKKTGSSDPADGSTRGGAAFADLGDYQATLRRSGRFFVGAIVIVFLIGLIGLDSEDFKWQYYFGGWAVGLASLYVAWVWPKLWLIAPFGALASVLLVRAGTGDLESGIGPLLLVPIFAVSAYGSRRSLVTMLASIAAVALLVRILFVDDDLLTSAWRNDFILLLVGGVLAVGVQDLVDRVRRGQALADARSRNIATLSAMTRRMATSADGGHTLTSLVVDTTDALGASIFVRTDKGGWKPIAEWGTKPGTQAADDLDPDAPPWPLIEQGSRWSISSTDREFEFHASKWSNPDVESIVWQPVLDDENVVGAMAFAWGEPSPKIDESPLPLEAIAAEGLVAVQQHRLSEQLKNQARTDPLTGIDNRRAWESEITRTLARIRRNDSPLAIAVIDLDNFKAFNDRHGHPGGDALLKDTVAAWVDLLRAEDHLARYGGDEFMLTLPDTRPDQAEKAIERLRDAMPHGETCSVGIASYEPGDSIEDLVRRADEALYREKNDRAGTTPQTGPQRTN